MQEKNTAATTGQNILDRLDRMEKSLQRIEAILSGQLSPMPDRSPTEEEPEESARVTPLHEKVEGWRKWYNSLWQKAENQVEVQAQINDVLSREPEACILDFKSDTEFFTNQTYAELTASRQGSCFILRVDDEIGANSCYVAFPYPSSNIWFERGVVLLERLYTIYDNSGFLNPRINVLSVALMQKVPPDRAMIQEPVYRLQTMGALRVQAF
ncbi:MAG TPA: hypothetical protein PKJ47_08140 [Candidatus Limiplasma sp.]|nr:hypothetical protein [Candidatus Limiplasma sp.]